MDSRINEIRCKVSILQAEMVRVEHAMHDQIRRDLDCTDSALQLLGTRKRLAALVAEWKTAGGSESLPTIEERLKANGRPAKQPKTLARR
jgi:hypothetical protein